MTIIGSIPIPKAVAQALKELGSTEEVKPFTACGLQGLQCTDQQNGDVYKAIANGMTRTVTVHRFRGAQSEEVFHKVYPLDVRMGQILEDFGQTLVNVTDLLPQLSLLAPRK